MPRRLLLPALLLGLVSFVIPAAAAAPDPRALLAKVESTYRGLDSFQAEGLVTMHASKGAENQSFDIPFLSAAATPGRSRTEMHHPQIGIELITDGTSSIVYSIQSRTYTRKPAPLQPPDGGPTGSPLSRYFNITRNVLSARYVRDEAVAVNGHAVPCTVIETHTPAPAQLGADSSTHQINTYWIDPARSLILRDSMSIRVAPAGAGDVFQMIQTTGYTTMRANEPVPDSMWVFTPPAGATEVSDFQAAGQPPPPDLTGKKAPAFSLTDLAGRRHTLAGNRGKVVLLDFWATWCNPCRISMPHVAKLHREFAPRGLVVFAVDLGENATKVSGFLKANRYTFTCLLDKDNAVAQLYQANAIPTTVVIDRTGTVVGYFTGVHEESELRAALKKAGL